jgi:hypothetical protein
MDDEIRDPAHAFDEKAGLVYRFRPRMMGPDFELRLGPDMLEWKSGHRGGRIAYPMIARLRLAFRPSGLSTRRYVAELWLRGGGRIAFYSSSPRAVVDVVEHAAEYRAFVIELVRRIGAAGAGCRFEAGLPAWRWWPLAVLGAVTFCAIVYVGLRALFAGEFGIAAVIAGFGALFLWQVGVLIVRNRPGVFRAGAIPDDVLPKG